MTAFKSCKLNGANSKYKENAPIHSVFLFLAEVKEYFLSGVDKKPACVHAVC